MDVLICGFLLSFLQLLCISRAEVFTSMAELENLIISEKDVVETLENYLAAEEARLLKVRRYTNEFKELYRKVAADGVEKFIAHPVNTYRLIKRLTTDWKEIEDSLNAPLGREYLQIVFNQRSVLTFPTDEDLTGVAVALSRLQDTYRIDSLSIAKGKIKGVAVSPSLTPAECFELGRVLYNFKDYDHSIDWMTTALQRFDDVPATELSNDTTSRVDVLEYLAFGNYMKGDVRTALRFTNQLLAYEPTHERAQNNIGYYEKEIAVRSEGRKKGDDGKTVVAKKGTIQVKPNNWETEKRLYEVLCRGEKQADASVDPRLKCYYAVPSPSFVVQPVKAELLNIDPDMLMYHQVVSDNEMTVIKMLAAPRLARATVQNSITGELETAHYRISKSAWLHKDDHEVIDRVNKRITAITGLDTDYAEELQIANYGIGGHYEPHFDFARKAEAKAFQSLGMGNRIATWLLYMSDVEAGGATVFPRLNKAFWPEKGSAVFWHNLHKNGEGDLRTRHAACPVLSGVKWVSNKWIHEYGQEFRRPCGLTPDGYEPEDSSNADIE
ncbi:hypothetical protein RvY_16550 [Ramazzottius varieornatus]|uniref:procollagen-proline 4-dioxygenase n=1 Tax=Ramazzottius varieornatus TaxID=947166 RepID=A0A1D1W584_RAMVA|nr:hypothetical protein RvY_16550 [Ramazzottius varieornatus]